MSGTLATSTHLAALRLRSANRYIFRALLSIASAALLARLGGMFMQIVVTARFGAGASMDAYFIASTFPTTLGYLLISIVETSVIPVYTRIRSTEGREAGSRLFSTLLNLLIVSMTAFTVLLCVFRQQVFALTAPMLDPARAAIVQRLTLLTYSTVLPLVIIGLLEAILNAEGQYGWPAYAGLLVPFCTALAVILLGHTYGVMALCVGALVGLCLQLGVFLYRLYLTRLRYQLRIDLRHPALRRILLAAWPIFLSACISNASPLIDQMFASSLSPGSISSLSYALKLVSVFSGVIFISLGRAVLPYLSRPAVEDDLSAFKGTLRLYLWGVGIGTLILSLGVLLLAHPIVALLFQRGAFSAVDTERTATTLMGFMVGLVPMSLGVVTAKAFSALGKTRVLMGVSLFSVTSNALLDALFAHLWQCQGIALATSVYYVGTMLLMFFVLRRLIGRLNLLTFPPEFVQSWSRLTTPYLHWRGRSQLALFRRFLWRGSLFCLVLAAGVYGVLFNALYTVRVSLGAIGMILLVRYRSLLLAVWVLLSVILSPNIPFLTNNNLLSGLTIPTLLVWTTLPFFSILQRVPPLRFFLLFQSWFFAGIVYAADRLPFFLTAWFTRLNYLALSMCAISLVKTRKRLFSLIDLLLLGTLFVVSYGLYGYLRGENGVVDPTTHVFRIFSVFSSAPSLALFLTVVFPLALFRCATVRRWARAAYALVCVAMLIALVLTFTRGAFVSLPLSLLVLSVLLFSRRANLRIFSVVLLGMVALFAIVQLSNLPIFDRFLNSDVGTLNGRTYLWQVLFSHFDAGQVLGAGFGAADTLLLTTKVGFGGGVIASSVSNLYVGTLYDHGVIGLLLLLLLFLSLVVSLLQGWRRASGERRFLFAVVLAAVVNILIQSWDLNDFWNQAVGLYFWLIVALPFAQCWSEV